MAQLAINRQMSGQVSRGSAGYSQAEEQVRCRAAQLSTIKQMSRQVSLGSVGDYQADEQAGVARLSW